MLITLQVQRLIEKKRLERYTLSGSRFFIGRSKRCTIRTTSDFCSRLQATLYERKDGQVYLRDLGGVNTTQLNAEPIKLALLNAGDEILVGDVKITVIHLLKTEPFFKRCLTPHEATEKL